MAEVIGMGLTYYPMLAGADTHMANLLKTALKDPDIPEEMKHRTSWSELARKEWSDDASVAAAAEHRLRLLEDLQPCRSALDKFEPDVLII